MVTHQVLWCTCATRLLCPVPGHVQVPPDPVDPNDLVAAGEEALRHIDAAVQSLLAARAAWVSRGLEDSNPFPRSLDRLAETLTRNNQDLRLWVVAAKTVAARRYAEAR